MKWTGALDELPSGGQWAVVAEYNGKPVVAPGRYTKAGVSFSIELLKATYGDRNFRAVEVGEGESSADVERRLADSQNSELSGSGPA